MAILTLPMNLSNSQSSPETPSVFGWKAEWRTCYYPDVGQRRVPAEVPCCSIEYLLGTFGEVVRVSLYRELEGGITAWNVRSRNCDGI